MTASRTRTVKTGFKDGHQALIWESLLCLSGKPATCATAITRYQAAVAGLLTRFGLSRSMGISVTRALSAGSPQRFGRFSGAGVRILLDLRYLEPYGAVPLHARVVSSQLVLRGEVRVQEYDRIARVGSERLLPRKRTDGWRSPGDVVPTAEFDRNVHAFTVAEHPCLLLHFRAWGLMRHTFDDRVSHPPKQRMLSIAAAPGGDFFIARDLAAMRGEPTSC